MEIEIFQKSMKIIKSWNWNIVKMKHFEKNRMKLHKALKNK